MRNIADIVKDDRDGKRLSQTERQVAVAYTQGLYDAVRELKIGNHSNTDEILNKIKAEIMQMPTISLNANDVYKADVLTIINKYMTEQTK